MKKIILFIICIAPALLFAQEGKFVLKGKIGQLNNPAKMYLMLEDDGRPDSELLDSCNIKNGAFEFTGTVTSLNRATLVLSHNGERYAVTIKSPQFDYLNLLLEPVQFSVSSVDSVKKASIKGSPANADYDRFSNTIKPIKEKINALIKEIQAEPEEVRKSEEFQKKMDKLYDPLANELKAQYKAFVQENPDSYISMFALNSYAGGMPDLNEVEPLFNQLSDKVKNSKNGKEFATRMDQIRITAIGAIAPDFTQNDPNGNPIKLSDFRGKYLLIDFWASWCGPCRKENPNVVKAYNEFKDKNFEILGVSLDDEVKYGGRPAWLAAIEKDGLTWPQVSDLKYWKNEVAQQYAIFSIPQNLLLDPTGKIIAKNLRGEELAKKLAEFLK